MTTTALTQVGKTARVAVTLQEWAVLERLRKGKVRGEGPKLARLSPQEERILDMIGEGLTNREIAERIHLSDKTVKNHVSTILQKL